MTKNPNNNRDLSDKEPITDRIQQRPKDERKMEPLTEDQRKARESYFHGSGVTVVDAPPGGGKSYTTSDVVANAIYQALQADADDPTRGILYLEFAREDAEVQVSDVLEWLEEHVAACEATGADDPLLNKIDDVRRALEMDTGNQYGTFDAFVGGVFRKRVASEIGFTDTPTVSNNSVQENVSRRALQAIGIYGDSSREPMATNYDVDQVAADIDWLREAYQTTEYKSDLPEMVESALTTTRNQALTTETFVKRLHEGVKGTYPNGPPADFDDVLKELEARCQGSFDADAVREQLTGNEKEVVRTDQEIYKHYEPAVERFGRVLNAYAAEYDARCKQRSVVSSADATWHTIRYLNDSSYDGDHRDDLLESLQTKWSHIVIDEAMDLSRAQYEFVRHLVDEETRVLLVGDFYQSIYTFRGAEPSLFHQFVAAGDGEDIDNALEVPSDRVETVRLSESYRQVPELVHATNHIFGDFFDDSNKAGINAPEHRPLVPSRTQTNPPGPHLHVLEMSKNGLSSRDIQVRASAFANWLSEVLENERIQVADDDGGTRPLRAGDIILLFRRSKPIDVYRRALVQAGVDCAVVRQGRLFDAAEVAELIPIIAWLADPYNDKRVRHLLSSAYIDIPQSDMAMDKYRAHGRDFDTWTQSDVPERFRDDLSTLADLQDQAVDLRHGSKWAAVDAVIDAFDAESVVAAAGDSGMDSRQRLANLRKLRNVVGEWDDEHDFDYREFAEILTAAHAGNIKGPNPAQIADKQSTNVARIGTIHSWKGREAPLCAIPELQFPLELNGVHSERLVTTADRAWLKPPEVIDDPVETAVDKFEQGVISHGESGFKWRDEGYRAPSELRNPATAELLYDHYVANASRQRYAEWYRLSHVAFTRGASHVVLPLGAYKGQDDLLLADAFRSSLNVWEGDDTTLSVSSGNDEHEVTVRVERAEVDDE